MKYKEATYVHLESKTYLLKLMDQIGFEPGYEVRPGGLPGLSTSIITCVWLLRKVGGKDTLLFEVEYCSKQHQTCRGTTDFSLFGKF